MQIDPENLEEALESILLSPNERSTERVGPVEGPNGETYGDWDNYEDMVSSLRAEFPTHEFPTANNVRGFVKDRGYTLEQALRFHNPPWMETDEWRHVEHLISEQGFEFRGRRKPQAIPVPVYSKKVIFESQKAFAQAISYDAGDLGKLMKRKNLTPEGVLNYLGREVRPGRGSIEESIES